MTPETLEDTCPCWTDPELCARGLYCPACTAEIEADPRWKGSHGFSLVKADDDE